MILIIFILNVIIKLGKALGKILSMGLFQNVLESNLWEIQLTKSAG